MFRENELVFLLNPYMPRMNIWLTLVLLVRDADAVAPSEVHLGALFPMFKSEVCRRQSALLHHARLIVPVCLQAAGFGLDSSGLRRFTSFYLALAELNNKTDGIADNLLPNTQLKFALRDSKRSSADAFFSALQLGTEVFSNQGVSAIVGAASSSPSTSAAVVASQLQARLECLVDCLSPSFRRLLQPSANRTSA